LPMHAVGGWQPQSARAPLRSPALAGPREQVRPQPYSARPYSGVAVQYGGGGDGRQQQQQQHGYRQPQPPKEPLFGRRAKAAAAMAAAERAMGALAEDAPMDQQFSEEMESHEKRIREDAEATKAAEMRVKQLAEQVQQLVAQLKTKDSEIAVVTKAKMGVESRWRNAEMARVQSRGARQGGGVVAQPEGATTDAALSADIGALAMSVDAGPRFAEQLRAFVAFKVAESREQRQRARDRANRADKIYENAVLQRVRDSVYRKGEDFRQVFRMIDDDKSGELDYSEFREGLVRCGAVLTDEEFAILIKVVDNNGDGMIQYLEFAETMKVPDVETSKMAANAPYAAVAMLGGNRRDAERAAKWRERNEGQQLVAQGMGARHVAKKQPPKPGRIQGLNLLPKGDVLRKLAEQMEVRYRHFAKAFRHYDRHFAEDGLQQGQMGRAEFEQLLRGLGFAFTPADYEKLLVRIDADGARFRAVLVAAAGAPLLSETDCGCTARQLTPAQLTPADVSADAPCTRRLPRAPDRVVPQLLRGRALRPARGRRGHRGGVMCVHACHRGWGRGR
jgi:Ca2+-binding EF-hand superfamily protein